jgi:hypothetical protein
MTGDYTPDLMALLSANIIISTPEKWDGISRNWHSRSYVTKVSSSMSWAYVDCVSLYYETSNNIRALHTGYLRRKETNCENIFQLIS